ncbi:sarcosine oxidase subunit gamma family protein [Mycoplana ramosa]|uniref:Sarcosine oxidase subunit gamma family protein n=1 Tax=Mycoplana ramosa TaxID=40837 RepID=A0ABW3YQX0_MYCRA
MLDLAGKWQPEPDWAQARLTARTIEVRAVTGVPQRLVSGEIDRFLVRYGLDRDVGALGLAIGDRYAVRVARDRLLVVGLSASDLRDGWYDEGYAISNVSSALRLFEARGEGVRDLLARATTVDHDNPGPCAAMPFAGVMGTLYRHGDARCLRIHVDRGLAAYLWEWFQCQPLFLQE